jgi:hypothetical protein
VHRKKDNKSASAFIAGKIKESDIVVHSCRSTAGPYYYYSAIAQGIAPKLADFYSENKIINNFSIEDSENTVFKYPQNKLQIQLNYGKILKKVNNASIVNVTILLWTCLGIVVVAIFTEGSVGFLFLLELFYLFKAKSVINKLT